MTVEKGLLEESGIYIIINLVNKKYYIGQSINIKRRASEHLKYIRKGNHFNDHLKKAILKYGEQNFEFGVIEYCQKSFLNGAEHYWCVMLDSRNPRLGYNIRPTSSDQNIPIAEELKRKFL